MAQRFSKKISIMKFGGSSVSDIEKMRIVAELIINEKKKNKNVVVVVSAPGDTTDELILKAKEITPYPDLRELDMLLSTGEIVSASLLGIMIKSMGYDAISLSGPQAGIYADSLYTRAKITKIKPKKIIEELKKNKIVIVAGFQALNPYNDITTLGRGGSDLTAVALAGALGVKSVDVYTDVAGVFTADPRICEDALNIPVISYDEMLELASAGAQVMQARSIEVAKKFGIDIIVRSTFTQEGMTMITKPNKKIEEVIVSSVACNRDQVKFSILDVPDVPGIAAKVFGTLAEGGINIDMIIQSAAREGYNDISFTVSRADLKKTHEIMERVNAELKSGGVVYDENVAKVSIVGIGMKSHSGVAAKMFKTLADNNINIQMISTSEIMISCIIDKSEAEKAVIALHKAFELGKK